MLTIVFLLLLLILPSLSSSSSAASPLSRLIDLRSDTVTRPTLLMRQAMAAAEVGDDVYGEDPTVHALETRVASMFQKEKALFLPSGTMANLCAVMTWCGRRGAEVILGDSSHIFLYEQGGTAQLAGVSARPLPTQRDGTMALSAIQAAIRSENIHFPITSMVAIENTHNYCGGRVLTAEYTDEVAALTRKRGMQ